MGRLFLFVMIAIIAGVISVGKSAIGRVTRNESLKNTSFKGEAKNVMNKTAKGINWMEAQWEESKKDAEPPSKKNTDSD